MISQHDLRKRFFNGKDSGKASNVQIRKLSGGYTALVGYGHAVYSVRSSNGTVVTYGGWYFQNCRGYSGSNSTKGQFSQMGLLYKCDTLMLPPKECGKTASEKRLYEKANTLVKDNCHDSAPKIHDFTVSGLDN